jgi:hypothetical protein
MTNSWIIFALSRNEARFDEIVSDTSHLDDLIVEPETRVIPGLADLAFDEVVSGARRVGGGAPEPCRAIGYGKP